MKKNLFTLITLCFLFVFSSTIYAGELYDNLANKGSFAILTELFQMEKFDYNDVLDLNAIFDEKNFPETTVVNAFYHVLKNVGTPELPSYQEVYVFHFEHNLLPPSLTDSDYEALESAFREKIALFSGTVRLASVAADSNGRGACRWVAPNAFVVMYICREVLGGFPGDGASLVTQKI